MAKQRRLKKILLYGFIVFLLGIVGTAGYAAYLTTTAKDVVDSSQHTLETRTLEKKSNLREKMVDPRVDNISVLFLGIDDTSDGIFGEATRTDAMVLATFNDEQKTIKMVSIPRDARIELVGRDVMDKAAHAHAFGGIDMAVNSVEKLFDVPVDYYVRVNFNAFIEIVDALGGIEIDVPFDIDEQDSERNKNAIHIEKGLQTLNGEEALAYARTRKYDSDLARGKRHQEVLEAIIKKGLSIKSVTKYGDVISSIGDNLTTNMSFDEMIAFHDYAYRGSSLDIEMLELSGRAARINHLYYYLLDDEAVENTTTTFKEHLELEE